jgi:hypothetical protein
MFEVAENPLRISRIGKVNHDLDQFEKPHAKSGTAVEKTKRLRIFQFVSKRMAEGVGFEPTVGCPTSVFKTDAIDHSATPPIY